MYYVNFPFVFNSIIQVEWGFNDLTQTNFKTKDNSHYAGVTHGKTQMH